MPRALAASHGARTGLAPSFRRAGVAPRSPETLDWYGFLARYFPGRRRHDLRALFAYAAYRRAPAADIRDRNGLAAWEDEGGATP